MKVSVVGLGYVGSVVAVGPAAGGHDVLGIDLDVAKVTALRDGKPPIYEPALQELLRKVAGRNKVRFLHTDEVSESLGRAIIVCTGTPATGGADLGQVRSALSWIAEKQPDDGVIAMKSTVPPGTGIRLRESALRSCRLQYASNPEFLREGQAVSDWFNPDRIVIGGDDPESTQVNKDLYSGIDAPYVVTDVTSAEMIKYAANAFLATKISFINEIAALCERLDVPIDDVRQGISLDPRIGPSFLQPGVGYGGACFPKDVRALDQLALTDGHNFELLRSVITVNNRQRLLPLLSLREEFGRLRDVSVGVLGLAFKPDTDDVREALALDLITALVEEGAAVAAYDPRGVSMARGQLPDEVRLTTELTECVDGARALVLMTERGEFLEADWAEIYERTEHPHFLFDGRNALDPAWMMNLGFLYRGVGRHGQPAISHRNSRGAPSDDA